MRAGSYLPTQRGTSSASLRTAAPDPPPSGHDHARNPHRLGVAWSKSAVRAILGNPRYTGYQVWNKQRRHDLPEAVRAPGPPALWAVPAALAGPVGPRDPWQSALHRLSGVEHAAPPRPPRGRTRSGAACAVGCASGACRASGSAVRPTTAAATPPSTPTAPTWTIRSTSTCARPTWSPSLTPGLRGWSARPTSRRPAAGWPRPTPNPPPVMTWGCGPRSRPGRLPAQAHPPPGGAGGRRRPTGDQPVDRRDHPAATPSPAHTPPAPSRQYQPAAGRPGRGAGAAGGTRRPGRRAGLGRP